MPCNCDYMNATSLEKELSRLYCVAYELRGKKVKESWWRGYHPDVYSKHLTKEEADETIKSVCSALKKIDVSKLSLEAQMWWRDHQKADKKREAYERSKWDYYGN